MSAVASKGKWAQGIRPRNIHWVIAERLAVCERPGGYGANHRKVRRQEEIIWVREQGFTCVISMIAAPLNLHNYDELGVVWRHRPVPEDDLGIFETAFFAELRMLLERGERILIHAEELSDRVCGLIAGYLLWNGLVESPPRVVTVIEQLTQRQLGPLGRELVAISLTIPPPSA
jgi:hypothetical protein